MNAIDTPQTLIIGVGNPWRGDDGVGLAVTRQLHDRGLPKGTRVIEHLGDGTHLMDLWENENKVVVVDAAHGGGQPGTLYRFDLSETGLTKAPGVGNKLPTLGMLTQKLGHSSHLFGVAEAIALAYVINRLPRQLIVFAVEGSSFDYGISLSAKVAKTVENLVKQILMEC